MILQCPARGMHICGHAVDMLSTNSYSTLISQNYNCVCTRLLEHVYDQTCEHSSVTVSNSPRITRVGTIYIIDIVRIDHYVFMLRVRNTFDLPQVISNRPIL